MPRERPTLFKGRHFEPEIIVVCVRRYLRFCHQLFDAAKRFLQAALANPDNRPPHVLSIDGNRSYPTAIRELKAEGELRPTCRHQCRQHGNNRIESDHRHVKRRLRAMQGRGRQRRRGR